MPILPSPSPAHSLSSSSMVPRSKKRRARPSHEAIKRNLAMLSDIPRPLSPTLPPSPPQSRAGSPEPPANKRRRVEEHLVPPETRKSTPTSTPPPPALPLPSRPPSVSAAAPPTLVGDSTPNTLSKDAPPRVSTPRLNPSLRQLSPPLRPNPSKPAYVRQKRIMGPHEMSAMADEYALRARTLKRSGEARLAGRRDPRTTLIGLLEMTEGLVEFMYQFWLGDEASKKIHTAVWPTMIGLVNACRGRWRDNAVTERQRAVIGLIFLIEACVYSRTSAVQFGQMSRVMDVAASSPAPGPSSTIAPLNSAHSRSSSTSHPTPPTLVSPEPSPHSTGSSSTSSPSPGRPTPSAHDVWDVARNIAHSAKRFNEGHAALSPAILSKLFPLTWARCSRSSLTLSDGHDVYPESCSKPAPPDADPLADEEAAWCWPPTSGEHIVHLIGFAKSLIWELARVELADAPYRGAAGVNTQY